MCTTLRMTADTFPSKMPGERNELWGEKINTIWGQIKNTHPQIHIIKFT